LRARGPEVAHAALLVALHRGGLLPFPLLRRLLVEFTTPKLGQHAGLSQARLNRRRAASKYSFSRTRTLGIETSIVSLDGRPGGDRGRVAGKKDREF